MGSNPDVSPGSNANLNAKTITLNFDEFRDIMGPVLLGFRDKKLGKLEMPDAHDFINWVGESGIDLAIRKLKDRASNVKDPNTGFCEACKGNFIKDSNGQLLWDSSNRAATDTFPTHGDPPKNSNSSKTDN